MTSGELILLLKKYPLDTPVNVHLEYKSGIILRCPGMEVNYIDDEGTLHDEPIESPNEISFFVTESLLSIKRKNK